MNTDQTAAYTDNQISSTKFRKLRMYRGKGPPFLKIGMRVYYDAADVDAWLEAQKRTSTLEATDG